jgi:glutaredoxin
MIRVTLYSRPGCHLCEVVERVLHHVASKRPFELVIQDIDENPADFERFKDHIPVVLVNGEEVGRHRLTAQQFEAALDRTGRAKG